MTDKPKKPMMPPVPRDHDDASMSEMMPFRSTKIKLFKSPVVLFMIISGLLSTALFGIMWKVIEQPGEQGFAAFKSFVTVTIFIMLLMLQVGIYSYSRTDRPVWGYLIAYAIVCVILMTPIGMPYFFVFRSLLPGSIETTAQTPFITAFISHFFGAGLMEELMKGTPILAGAALTAAAIKNPALVRNIVYRLMHVRGPLDGVVMGVFAGAGFIMIETAFQYVPDTAINIIKASGDYGTGIAAAMMLLIPRIMGGAVGHMAYAAIFGYFIGLAVLRKKQRWQLLGIGWLSASVIHALWNSIGQIEPNLRYAVALVAAIFAGAALLKARQIEASLLGRANATSGSILVDRPPQAPAAQPVRNPALAPAPAPAPAYVPPAATASAAAERPLALDIDGLIVPLRSGAALNLGIEPALAGRGAGVVGQIVPHPTRANVLGLQNGGDGAWTARLRDGSQQIIERNQNIRLAAGVQIDFGAGLTGRVVAVG